MNQQKTGEFLKHLRKEKGLTQEQLAEQFYISSRTVSRWETGSNMPDVDTLIELADFYDVDIREIIDGERKSEKMDIETKDTLKKVAEYVTEKEKVTRSKVIYIAFGICIILLICTILFTDETAGILYGIVPERICDGVMLFVYGCAVALLISYLKAHWFQEKPSYEPEKSVMASVISKEVKRGTHQTGRSKGGFSYAINFLTEDGQKIELFAHEIEFGGLREDMYGLLTYRGRYFVAFNENIGNAD